MEFEPYIVYVKTDDANRITAVNSSTFLRDVTGWTEIDSGHDDKYHHAQGNYFPKPIMDMRGIYRYKLEDGKAVERTQEEMDADYVPPVHQPTDKERIAALEEENAVLLECLLEMSEIVYA
ncbi:MAG: hypothetical protein IJ313_09930 [Clostridia bacterium]|nr:hypothetical protein [Clostridia bacterium]